MRVGLFGGTFNPIHLGHLRAAEEIRESFELQQVIFIPSAIPPHKEAKKIVSPLHRIEMVNLAIKGNRSFSASDIEIKRSGKSYSIETVDHITRIHGWGLNSFFIMGIDAFRDITTWKDYIDLFSSCNFVIMTRPRYNEINLEDVLPPEVVRDFRYVRPEDRFVHISNSSLYFRHITHLDISSSIIRKRIKENRSVQYLIPDEVLEYIKLHGLYKDS
ncbi:MAG: nicotinate-nucleotide adenylyltransferase [Pseudomonadota bacterium]